MFKIYVEDELGVKVEIGKVFRTERDAGNYLDGLRLTKEWLGSGIYIWIDYENNMIYYIIEAP